MTPGFHIAVECSEKVGGVCFFTFLFLAQILLKTIKRIFWVGE